MVPLKVTTIAQPQPTAIALTISGLSLFVQIDEVKHVQHVENIRYEQQAIHAVYNGKPFHIPLEEDAYHHLQALSGHLILTDKEGTPWLGLRISLTAPDNVAATPEKKENLTGLEGEFTL